MMHLIPTLSKMNFQVISSSPPSKSLVHVEHRHECCHNRYMYRQLSLITSKKIKPNRICTAANVMQISPTFSKKECKPLCITNFNKYLVLSFIAIYKLFKLWIDFHSNIYFPITFLSVKEVPNHDIKLK